MTTRIGFHILLGALLVMGGLAASDAVAQAAHAARWLRIIGEDPAAKRVILSLAGSGAARSALEKLGIRAASEREAIAKLAHLTPEQTSAIILHDTKLGHAYLSEFGFSTRELRAQMGLYNTLRENRMHQKLMRADVSKDAEQLFSLDAKTGKLVAPGKPWSSADLGTGRITLERPYVICKGEACKVEVKEINAYKAVAAVAGGYTCWETKCYSKAMELLRASSAPSTGAVPGKRAP